MKPQLKDGRYLDIYDERGEYLFDMKIRNGKGLQIFLPLRDGNVYLLVDLPFRAGMIPENGFSRKTFRLRLDGTMVQER